VDECHDYFYGDNGLDDLDVKDGADEASNSEKIEEGQIPNTNGIRLEELDEESDEDEEENLDNVILPSRKRMPDNHYNIRR